MMKKISLLAVILIITLSSHAQQFKSVIPYSMVGDKMIVEMQINGVTQRLIFDTGGRTSISERLFNELNLPITDSLEVTDVNSKKSFYKMVALNSILTTENGINFKGYPALVIFGDNPFKCYSAEGLIGNDILKNSIIEIDHKAKIIVISSAEIAPKISPRQSYSFINKGTAPIIEVNLDNQSFKMLFDTGYGGLLSLKSADFDDKKFNVVGEAYSEGDFGAGGKGKARISKRLLINTLNFSSAKFNGIIAETSTPPFTLIGMEMLNYGKVTIDFARCVLYFEAYEKINHINNTPQNIYFKVEEGKLKVSTVWGEFKGVLENGDIVTHINGKPTRNDYDFCESVTIGIRELKEKKINNLIIQTKKGIQKIKYIK